MTAFLENCSLQELCESLGGNEQLCKELTDRLLEWFELQPHLPKYGKSKEEHKRRLEYLIAYNKFSLERAKQKLDMYYTIRHLAPELFSQRDPLGDDFTRTSKAIQIVSLPKLTPNKFRVTMFRPKDLSLLWDYWEPFKYSFMIGDVRISEDRGLGEIWVYDLSNVQMNQITKLTPTVVKKSIVTATEAFSCKIKGLHFINAPYFIDKIMVLLKGAMKPKIAQRLYVHSSGIESLYELVPRSIFPVDYGGDEESLDVLHEKWVQKLIEWRDWFLTDGASTTNEKLRPSELVNVDDLFGFHGSFRKLEVD